MVETHYSLQSLLAVWLLSSWLILSGISAYIAVVANGPWMIRYLGIVLLFTPAILAGAYEIFWLLIASATMSAVFLERLRRNSLGMDRRQVDRSTRAKFSISSILFVTALLAGVVAVALQTPALNQRAWLSVFSICVTSSVMTVVAYYVGQSKRKRTRRVAIAGLSAIVPAIPVSFFDWLLLSFYIEIGWPPDRTSLTWGLPGVVPPSLHPEWMWYGVTAIVVTSLVLWTSVWYMKSGLGSLVLATGLAGYVVPPLLLSLQLISVPELPALASDNAYSQVATLSARVADSNFEKAVARFGDWESIPATRLSSIFSAIGVDLDELSKELQRSIWAPVDFSMENMPMDDIQNFRTVSKAFVARAQLRKGNPIAASDCLSAIQLGVRTRKGGLLIQHLVGRSCASFGLRTLYFQRDFIDNDTIVRTASQLIELSEELDPIQQVIETERIWMMRQGWHSHLTVLLAEWAGESIISIDVDDLIRQSLQEQTLMHLLAADLALQGYQRRNRRPPDSLQELIPNWLPVIPHDFLAREGSPLQYQRIDGGYLLFSVGLNGIDENGSFMENPLSVLPMDDDLRLDSHFR